MNQFIILIIWVAYASGVSAFTLFDKTLPSHVDLLFKYLNWAHRPQYSAHAIDWIARHIEEKNLKSSDEITIALSGVLENLSDFPNSMSELGKEKILYDTKLRRTLVIMIVEFIKLSNVDSHVDCQINSVINTIQALLSLNGGYITRKLPDLPNEIEANIKYPSLYRFLESRLTDHSTKCLSQVYAGFQHYLYTDRESEMKLDSILRVSSGSNDATLYKLAKGLKEWPVNREVALQKAKSKNVPVEDILAKGDLEKQLFNSYVDDPCLSLIKETFPFVSSYQLAKATRKEKITKPIITDVTLKKLNQYSRLCLEHLADRKDDIN